MGGNGKEEIESLQSMEGEREIGDLRKCYKRQEGLQSMEREMMGGNGKEEIGLQSIEKERDRRFEEVLQETRRFAINEEREMMEGNGKEEIEGLQSVKGERVDERQRKKRLTDWGI